VVRAALFLVLFSAAAGPARADWYATPFAGLTFGTGTNFVDLDQATDKIKFAFGGTVTLLGPGILGVEGDFSMMPGFFQRGPDSLIVHSRVTTLMGNVVVAMPLSVTQYSLRPYASGGAGLMRSAASDKVDLVTFSRNLFGMNAGGGVIGLISDKRGVRFDLRYFRNVKTVGEGSLSTSRASLSFWRASAGVILKF
jgi:opacity protein-like surface antigen